MIWSALVLGLAGSLHCLAMCGPLVVTVHQYRSQSALNQLVYHSGRILIYVSLGAIVGVFGLGIKLSSSQQVLSVATGFLLLCGLIFSVKGITGMVSRMVLRLKGIMGNLKGGRPLHLLGMGAINGLLPCGLTYVALAAALSTTDVVAGMTYMAVFGLGTTPMLWILVRSLSLVPKSWRSSRAVINVSTLVLAVLLILRGMDLGIPYVSPEFKTTEASVITVCK